MSLRSVLKEIVLIFFISQLIIQIVVVDANASVRLIMAAQRIERKVRPVMMQSSAAQQDAPSPVSRPPIKTFNQSLPAAQLASIYGSGAYHTLNETARDKQLRST